jgi:hypothetical protein
MKRYLILFLAFCSLATLAQQGIQTIRGTVLDQQSKYQLAGATVVVVDSDPINGTTADENGEFRLTNIPLGRHTIKISFLGYSERTIPNILVQQGKETFLAIELEEMVIESDEVVVTSEVDKTNSLNEMSTVSTRQFSREDAARYAGSLNDPSRMAANFAGVSGSNDSRNDIIIRGNSPSGLLWRMDGMPIPNPSHFGATGTTGGPVSMLNYNLLANSDFMTGAFPAEYGNATSGVFDLQMRTGNNKKREYLGQVGFNGLELGAEGPFSKNSRASYVINYRYSTLGIFKTLGINLGTGQAVPEYQDLSMKIDLPTKNAGRFSLFAVGGSSKIELLESTKDTTKDNSNLYSNDGFDIYYKTKTGIVGLNHLYFFNPTTSIKTGIMASGITNDFKQDSIILKTLKTLDHFLSQREESRIVGTIQLNKKISAKNTLVSGAYLQRIGYLYDERILRPSEGYWEKLRSSNGYSVLTEVYSQWKHRFSEQFSTNIGVHFQHLALNNTTAIEPRLGFRYQFKPKQSLNLGLGIHNQMQPIQVYFQQTRLADNSYLNTNKNLGFTRSSQIVLGYDNNFAKNWRLKVEGYYQNLDNVPVEKKSSSFSMLNAGADFSFPDNDSLENKGTGYNYGIELTVERFLGNGFYFLSTTSLFQSRYKGSDGIERNTAFNGNYVQNLLVGKEFKIKSKLTFLVDLKATYAGGKRYQAVDLAESRRQQQVVYDKTNPYELQLPDYFRPDIKLSLRKEGKRITQEFVLSLQNVINRQNLFTRTYSRAQDKMVDQYQLGIFPVPQYRVLF